MAFSQTFYVSFFPEVSMLFRKFIHTGSFIQPTAITINFLSPKSLSDFPLVTVTTHCISDSIWLH